MDEHVQNYTPSLSPGDNKIILTISKDNLSFPIAYWPAGQCVS